MSNPPPSAAEVVAEAPGELAGEVVAAAMGELVDGVVGEAAAVVGEAAEVVGEAAELAGGVTGVRGAARDGAEPAAEDGPGGVPRGDSIDAAETVGVPAAVCSGAGPLGLSERPEPQPVMISKPSSATADRRCHRRLRATGTCSPFCGWSLCGRWIAAARLRAAGPGRVTPRVGSRMSQMNFDPYHRDVLAGGRTPKEVPAVQATGEVVAEDPVSGFCGLVVGCTSSTVILEDRHGSRRQFPLITGGFMVDGRYVTLVRPTVDPPRSRRSASGSVAVAGRRARTAKAARIWVEGIHDAALIERVWGHDLRVEGIVVEPLHGLDRLPEALAEFEPGPGRRVGVLADHLVAGSKEQRIADSVGFRDVLVAGHPYIDIWQAVRPEAVGIRRWPEVPRGMDWKAGVCRALGVSDPATMWGRVNGAVHNYRQLQTPLITAVESLIDFVTVLPD